LSLGTDVARLQLATDDARMAILLSAASLDIQSVTRARGFQVVSQLDAELETLPSAGEVRIALNVA
jgi:hypothetical protein